MSDSRMKEQLGYIIASVNRELEEELEERLRPAGVPIEQLRVLEVLHNADGRSMGEAAAAALVDAPTLTKIIDRMVSDNLVFRGPDPSDRRRVLIFLAAGGKALYKRLRSVTAAQEKRLSRNLDPHKMEELRGLLRELVAN
jgi:MarR family transcriptional regulator, organic hydroperoxide resistance regulator